MKDIANTTQDVPIIFIYLRYPTLKRLEFIVFLVDWSPCFLTSLPYLASFLLIDMWNGWCMGGVLDSQPILNTAISINVAWAKEEKGVLCL